MEKPSFDQAGFRHEYIGEGLRRRDLDPNPINQFHVWFGAAIKAGIHDANAMALATATLDGKPSARIVLLKDFDERGFVFYTNYASEKGRQLEKNPRAALVLYWMEVERQIRIEGAVERTLRGESEQYFHTRPAGAQLGVGIASERSDRRAARACGPPRRDEAALRQGRNPVAAALGRIST